VDYEGIYISSIQHKTHHTQIKQIPLLRANSSLIVKQEKNKQSIAVHACPFQFPPTGSPTEDHGLKFVSNVNGPSFRGIPFSPRSLPPHFPSIETTVQRLPVPRSCVSVHRNRHHHQRTVCSTLKQPQPRHPNKKLSQHQLNCRISTLYNFTSSRLNPIEATMTGFKPFVP